jgi:cellulose synthase/poly-beta-1,6-N-acetylglucosamine synthase-like glycosyltransferase
MTRDLALSAFWVSLLVIGFSYLGFPLLVMLVGRLRNRVVEKQPITPRMSLIIAAYNEEDCIAERLVNALAADHPGEALEIIVASDGSSDRTEEIVASFAPRGVRLLRLPRQGKIPALTAAVARARGEILVFSDANTMMETGALRALASNFADASVGGVAGNTGYTIQDGSDSSSRGENGYWRYDTWIKELESRTGSVVSAHGGLYALRRELFQAPVDTAVTDDFIISTGVVEQGRRLVFESDARAYEVAVPRMNREFSRRVRLMTRGLRGVSLRRRLLNPARYGFYAVVLFSHKILRRLVPIALVALLVSTLYLTSMGTAFLMALMAQLGIYSFAAVGYLTRSRPVGEWRCFYVPFFFCMANLAALIALVRFARGERVTLWQPQRHVAQV